MRWIGTKEQTAYMRLRQGQNRARTVSAEVWAERRLAETGKKWTRQAIWGCRLFDFWNAGLGIAIEIDGAEHDPVYDQYRDRYNYYRSGILVLRVPNFDDAAMDLAIDVIRNAETHAERKEKIRRSLGMAPGAPMKGALKIMGIPKAHLKWEPRLGE